MKKLIAAVAVVFFSTMQAQKTNFGATAGMLTGFAKAKAINFSETNSSTGYFLGLFAEISAGEKIKIQPGINYANIDDSSAMQVPVMVKYFAAPKFNIQFGPQFLFDFSETTAEIDSFYNKTNFALALGAGYDFTEKFFAEARYSLQLNNHLKNAPSGYSLKANYLNLGLGYKF